MGKIKDYWDFSNETQKIINNLPVVISLQYGINYMKFQVNPESIRREIPSESTKARIENLGEIATPSKPGLSTIHISSFFWQDRNMTPSIFYVNWLKRWQKSKRPAKLIITKLNYSMYVTCENFSHETRAGEENDIYFDLQLQEYRKFGAKIVGIPTVPSWFESYLSIEDDITAPILVDIPRPNRMRNLKIILNPYKSKSGDTLVSITKKIRGTSAGWKDLYNLNKNKLGDIISEGDGQIPSGVSLDLPEGWSGVLN